MIYPVYDRHTCRAKDAVCGVWRYGSYLPAVPEGCPYPKLPPHLVALPSNDMWKIDPATLGQCTGLTDITGAAIFEGDILRDCDGDLFIMEWSDKGAGFRFRDHGAVCCPCETTFEGAIIGNIHDSPELLKSLL